LAILVWITGLSGSGKTTIGKEVYNKIKKKHENTIFLDGDDFRNILGNDLGHNQNDRIKNALRIHRMCKFLTFQNINVICTTMSLYKEIHDLNRSKINNYFEIFIECNIDELKRRDQKGLYSKAKNVVGIDLTYDKPKSCELVIENSQQDKLQEKIQKILDTIGENI